MVFGNYQVTFLLDPGPMLEHHQLSAGCQDGPKGSSQQRTPLLEVAANCPRKEVSEGMIHTRRLLIRMLRIIAQSVCFTLHMRNIDRAT
jgi:hypothetical protein